MFSSHEHFAERKNDDSFYLGKEICLGESVVCEKLRRYKCYQSGRVSDLIPIGWIVAAWRVRTLAAALTVSVT